MTDDEQRVIEREAIVTTSLLRAAEDWSSQYEKDLDSHATLIKNEAKWQIAMVKFFKSIADRVDYFINWSQYSSQVSADYNLEVIIDESASDDFSNEFMRVSLEFVTVITAAGAQSGESIYGIPLGITSTNAAIQRLSTQHVARLVGKRVLPDGTIVDNPRAEYNITNTMRKDIAESIKRSLAMGVTVQEAREQVQKIIKDPKRAERIARTESINAYQAGLTEFGIQSGAVGKVWLDVGATDVCSVYADMGPVPFDFRYGGELLGPVAHPGCRCGRRLIYQKEWDDIHKK